MIGGSTDIPHVDLLFTSGILLMHIKQVALLWSVRHIHGQ